MTNMAIVELIKKLMEIDEDYFLKKWELQFDKTDIIKFRGDLIPRNRSKK